MRLVETSEGRLQGAEDGAVPRPIERVVVRAGELEPFRCETARFFDLAEVRGRERLVEPHDVRLARSHPDSATVSAASAA